MLIHKAIWQIWYSKVYKKNSNICNVCTAYTVHMMETGAVTHQKAKVNTSYVSTSIRNLRFALCLVKIVHSAQITKVRHRYLKLKTKIEI